MIWLPVTDVLGWPTTQLRSFLPKKKKKIKIKTMKLAIFSGLREKVARMTAADQSSVSSTYYAALSPNRSGVGNHN